MTNAAGSGGGVYGSGTMMLIAVVAAVITGTAVAFLIIFVRKWFVALFKGLFGSVLAQLMDIIPNGSLITDLITQ